MKYLTVIIVAVTLSCLASPAYAGELSTVEQRMVEWIDANAEDAIALYPDLGCMVGLFEYNPPACYQALKQAGYISGETLINHYDPCNITVVSTWQTIDDWIRWEESDERSANENQLEALQEGPADFEIYDLGLDSGS